MINEPLNISARCILRGGFAFSSARRALCTVNSPGHYQKVNRRWLRIFTKYKHDTKKISSVNANQNQRDNINEGNTYANHKIAELPSALRVISQASSSPT